MSTFAFSLRDASGEAHDFEGNLHPTSEGAPIVFALGSILGPMLGRALGAALVDGLPLDAIKAEIESVISSDSLDEALSVIEEVGARLLPKIKPSTVAPIPEKIGEAIGLALGDPRWSPILLEVFRHTRRDGKPLVVRDPKKNVLRTEGYDLAFRGNYTEMIAAFVKIGLENRFFGPWGTSLGETAPETASGEPNESGDE